MKKRKHRQGYEETDTSLIEITLRLIAFIKEHKITFQQLDPTNQANFLRLMETITDIDLLPTRKNRSIPEIKNRREMHRLCLFYRRKKKCHTHNAVKINGIISGT